MNSFVGGWLIGFACGLWFAIFLYWLWGKAAALRGKGAPSAPERESPPTAPPAIAIAEPPAAAPGRPLEQEPASPSTEASQTDLGRSRYTRLLSMAGGDAAAAERLIDYERTRAPDAARAILIQNAIDRLLHDRR